MHIAKSQVLTSIDYLKTNYEVQSNKMYIMNECYKNVMWPAEEKIMFYHSFKLYNLDTNNTHWTRFSSEWNTYEFCFMKGKLSKTTNTYTYSNKQGQYRWGIIKEMTFLYEGSRITFFKKCNI